MISRLSKEDREVIKKRILNGDTYRSISNDYKIAYSEIAFMGHEMGIVRKIFKPNHTKWVVSEIDKFLIAHDSTIRRVSTQIRHCKVAATWKCQLCGHEWQQCFNSLSIRVLNKGGKGCRECGYDGYTVYHDFFDHLTPLSAYFSGVFMASGSIQSNRVTITSKNKEKLEKIANIISCTYPVTKDGSLFRLSFKSTKIAKYLSAIKQKPRDIPKEFDNNLLTHFLRGYIDFRGFVEYFKSRQGNKQVRMTITGDLPFLTSLQTKYIEMTKALHVDEKERVGFVRKGHNEFYVTGTMSAYHFMNWIYNSEVNPLRYVSDSKYNTYLDLKQTYDRKMERREYIIQKRKDYDALNKQWKETLTLDQISKTYGVTFDQAKSISCGRSPTSLPEDVCQKVIQECIRRKQLKKQMRELSTKMTHKTGTIMSAAKCYKPYNI